MANARLITDAYREVLASELPKDEAKRMGLKSGATWAQAIALRGLESALSTSEAGNAARKEIREATEGRAGQRHEVPPNAGLPPQFVVSYAEPLKNVEREKVIDANNTVHVVSCNSGTRVGRK